MGILKKLFGRNIKDQVVKSPPPPKDDDTSPDITPGPAPVLEAYRQDQHEAAISAAAPHTDRHADANRLHVLACLDTRRYSETFPYWFALFKQEPSAYNALQLATVSVICGKLERGEAWSIKFDEINEQTYEMSSVTTCMQFISPLTQSGHIAEASPYLDWLCGVYVRVCITDSHFLYVRDVPFFLSLLENTLPAFKTSISNDKIVDRYGTLAGELNEEGEVQLEQWR